MKLNPSRRLFLASGPGAAVFAALKSAGRADAASLPLTDDERAALLDAYDEWLFYERRMLHVERFGLEASRRTTDLIRVTMAHNYHFPSFGEPEQAKPSSRAAVVLAAVGCDWRDYDS